MSHNVSMLLRRISPLHVLQVAILIILLQATVGLGEESVVAEEVSHLIEFVESSGCQFNRNGKWYSPGEAAQHIGKKYRYVKKRGMVHSAEDFIKYAAAKSSMSGRPYLIQCAEGKPQKSGEWLKTELLRYRKEK